MYDPTNLYDELNRKFFFAFERLANKCKNGEISYSQFKTGVLTLYDGFSGLLNEELNDFLTEAINEIQNVIGKRIFVFHTKGQTYIVSWVCGENVVKFSNLATFKQVITQKNSAIEAKEYFEQFLSKIEKDPECHLLLGENNDSWA